MVQTELLQAIKKIKEGSKMIRFIKISSVVLGSCQGLIAGLSLVNVLFPDTTSSAFKERLFNLGVAVLIALGAWLLIYLGLNYNRVVEK